MHRPRSILVGATLMVSTILAACSSSAAPAAGGVTITTATVGPNGTLIVAGSNGMTLYAFAKDVANSGTSACTDTCGSTWPALTVPAGASPTAAAGATGKIATISRSDTNGALQVTYNGLPLYFYSGDHAVGDSNGIYPDWSAVKP
jgi:predicted lipoprotein with Yx(FWY)xxD motif